MTTYRPADLRPGDDRAFVISTWASSYKHSHFAGILPTEQWSRIMHEVLAGIIDRPSVTTIVAADDTFLYGFICGDTTQEWPIVHYLYVKDGFRSETGRDGVRSGPRYGRGLFAALGVDPERPFLYSCRTSAVARLADKIPLGRFVPAAARYTRYQEREHEQRQRQAAATYRAPARRRDGDADQG